MADRDVFADRRRGLEEEYIRKREQELIEKLRRRAKEDEKRRRLGEQAGVADEEILQDLQALGYTPETVQLLHLVPLVEMAWVEGSVSPRERELITKAALARGIADDSAAGRQLTAWLTDCPPADFFERTLRAIGAMLEARPEAEREASRRDLLSYCAAIASAAGGILGFGAVSDEERQLLAHLTEELERGRPPSPRPGA